MARLSEPRRRAQARLQRGFLPLSAEHAVVVVPGAARPRRLRQLARHPQPLQLVLAVARVARGRACGRAAGLARLAVLLYRYVCVELVPRLRAPEQALEPLLRAGGPGAPGLPGVLAPAVHAAGQPVCFAFSEQLPLRLLLLFGRGLGQPGEFVGGASVSGGYGRARGLRRCSAWAARPGRRAGRGCAPQWWRSLRGTFSGAGRLRAAAGLWGSRWCRGGSARRGSAGSAWRACGRTSRPCGGSRRSPGGARGSP